MEHGITNVPTGPGPEELNRLVAVGGMEEAVIRWLGLGTNWSKSSSAYGLD